MNSRESHIVERYRRAENFKLYNNIKDKANYDDFYNQLKYHCIKILFAPGKKLYNSKDTLENL
jgi:hypothetical protein